MRKIVLILALLLLFATFFSACEGRVVSKKTDLSALKWSNELAFERAQELGYEGTLEEFLAQLQGAPGEPGKDGVGISTLLIDSEGKLVVVLTNGQTITLGVVKGEKGDPGEKGEKGDPGEKGEKGDPGKDGKDGKDASSATFAANGLAYVIDKEENCAIITGRGLCPDLDLVIPEEINGYPVTKIFEEAFDGDMLKSVVIPDSVTSIGYGAFYYCPWLTSVSLPDSLTYCGYSAFESCPSLQPNLINGCTYLGNAENPCVVLMEITDHSIVSFQIPARVKVISQEAFSNCSKLAKITVADGNTRFCVINDILYDQPATQVLYVPKAIQGAVTIPEGITTIGERAFVNCSALESIAIPNSVTSIGRFAFEDCQSLTAVTFGENSKLTSIGYYAFENCRSLESIAIPDGVTNIEYWTFWGCESLTTVAFGEASKLTSIGSDAFHNCYALGSIAIPDSVISIGSWAFGNCESLATVTFGENSQLTAIGDYAFEDCSMLENITIPDGVTSIDHNAFYNCQSLETVTFGKNSKLTSIGSDAFHNCYALGSIAIPDSVISIGSWAFGNCESLATVTFGENSQLTAIGDYAFEDCSMLENITIPDGVTSIGSYAFEDCQSLGSIAIPDSVTSIGSWSFGNCESLETVTFGENSQLTAIEDSVFRSCYALEDIAIPSSVTSIGSWAFADCYSLQSVILPGSIQRINDSAFRWCDSLSQIIFCGTAEEWNAVQKEDGWDGWNGDYQLRFKTGDHIFDKWTPEVPATCTQSGTKGYSRCLICGKLFDAENNEITDLTIPATPHDYGTWVEEVPASESELGIQGHYQCSKCGFYFNEKHEQVSLSDLIIPATGENTETGVYRAMTKIDRAGLDATYEQKLAATQAFAEVPAATGTTWYVSSIHGSDYNNGLSPETAWETTANCASKVKEGDTILFECGSVFRRTKNDYFIRGLKNNVTLGTYGEGAKPIFYGSINVPASMWTQIDDTNVYYVDEYALGIELNIYNDIGCIVFNEGEAWGVKTLMTFNDPSNKTDPTYRTLALEGVSNGLTTRDYPSYYLYSSADLQGDLSFYHDYNERRIYLYCEGGNPGERFDSVELSLSMFAFSMQSPATDVTVLNLDFRNFGTHVLRPMNCQNFTVKNCEFRFIGGAIQYGYGGWRNYYTRLGNAIENWDSCNGMTIENCFFDQIYDTAMTTQSNSDIVSTNITYRNNVAQNMWFGVELWSTSNVEFSNVDVSGNYFKNIGEGFTTQRPDKVDPGTDFSVNAFIKVSGGPYDTKGNFTVTNNIADGTNGKMVFCNYPVSSRYSTGVVFDYNTYIASPNVDFGRFFGKSNGNTYPFTENGIETVWDLGIETHGRFYYIEND